MVDEPIQPDIVAATEAGDETISRPSKLIRIASMTRATLDEVRQARFDEAGRKRLLDIYRRSLEELKEVLSPDLREELDEVFLPLTSEVPSESELRIAQAQLVGWLEGLFHRDPGELVEVNRWRPRPSWPKSARRRRSREAPTRLPTPAFTSEGVYFEGVYL